MGYFLDLSQGSGNFFLSVFSRNQNEAVRDKILNVLIDYSTVI